MNKITKFIGKNKVSISIVLSGFILFIVNVLIFYPGFMSADSITQLAQVMGERPVTDWHPPVMVLVWGILLDITGKVGSMLMLQLAMLWASLVLLAIYIHRITSSVKYAILPLVVGVAPFVISISGVIWKDCHMAFSLLLAAVLTLYLKQLKFKKAIRYCILVVIGLLILYACLLRHNALFAAIPLIYVAISYGISTRMRSQRILYTAAFVLVTFVAGSIVSGLTSARTTNPSSAVMLDDIVNTLSVSDVRKAGIDSDLSQIIQDAVHKCRNRDIVFNSIAYCSGKEAGYRLSYDHPEALRAVWGYMLEHKPWEYLGFRLHAFSIFMFTPERLSYYWNAGIEDNDLDQKVKFEDLGKSLSVYVIDFGYKYFSVLFMPWFWIVFNSILLGYAYKRLKTMRLFVCALAMSAVLYILSYAPVVIGVDYRYIYWSVFASLLAALLAWIDIRYRKNV
ncbi:MAG: hypothetical protein HZB75_00110 [Candidatus Saccharibacteria bacterium]|nr:MAG: hypothetical protein HZB75_00110 [Candidatus Saccharibacteria bacterium]